MALSIQLSWDTRVRLKLSQDVSGYSINQEHVPQSAGIYVFLREWRDTDVQFEALYVGQAEDFRRRMAQYFSCSLNPHEERVMRAIRESDPGTRWLLFGEVDVRQGQQIKGVLDVVEKALIAHYKSLGHRLVNENNTKSKKHTISSRRRFFREFIPATLSAEDRGSHRKKKQVSLVERATQKITDVFNVKLL